MTEQKFHFKCKKCGHKIPDFKSWFNAGQHCPKCGSNRVDAVYSTDKKRFQELLDAPHNPASLWHYFDFLPLNNKENIVSRGEGVVPIERWKFLENFAKNQHNITCKVYVLRNDHHIATGTFKDKGASLAASVLKENNIKQYIVASTGNTATAFSHYLGLAGINNSVFIPQDAIKQNEAEIGSYGQKVFKVRGDYAKAKHVAADYAKKYDIIITGGNFDPLRVEAKKTMVFEWMRHLGGHPSVYIQALSGGTGPFAIEKAYDDMQGTGLFDQLPRFILSQPSGCAPMAEAWRKAKANGFPKGFENDYPVWDNPETLIPTLATGNPKTYPAMSDLVKRSKGEILEFDETKAIDVARLVAYETMVRIGPASTIALGGFFQALKEGHLKNDDVVIINTGEGVLRASDFMEKLAYTTQEVDSVDDCKPFDREQFREFVYKPFVTNY